MSEEDDLAALRAASKTSATEASALLDQELSGLTENLSKLADLEPAVTDKETYTKLMKVVQEASNRNLSLAELKKNIEALGSGAVSLARQLSGMVK